MNAIGKTQFSDISLGQLLETLAASRDLPLIFRYGDRAVRPGYHVTEVKAGQFSALDCGANPEAWAEMFVQLWDIEEAGRTHMPRASLLPSSARCRTICSLTVRRN